MEICGHTSSYSKLTLYCNGTITVMQSLLSVKSVKMISQCKAGFHNMLLVQKLQIACHVPHINGWHQKGKNVYSKFLDSR